MAASNFKLRISNRTFERFAGHGYLDNGGTPEKLIAPEDFWSLHLSITGTIYDEGGKEIGLRFKNCETGELHDVFPGKVYNISVWTEAQDDDGRPEDICIDFYVELIPTDAI